MLLLWREKRRDREQELVSASWASEGEQQESLQRRGLRKERASESYDVARA